MDKSMLKFKKVVSPSATLQVMNTGMRMKLSTEDIKTSVLRSAASRLKKQGYLFRVSDKGLINETIVECLKSPVL